jgi:hypothetical protein
MDLKGLSRIIILICIVASSGCYRQIGFDYQKKFDGNYLATPTFKQKEPEGILGLPEIIDSRYKNDLFTGPVKTVLTKAKIDSLHQNTQASITYDIRGEILSCDFIIDSRDITILTEDILYKIYNEFIHTKVDLTKLSIKPDFNLKTNLCNYAYLSGGLVIWTIDHYDHIDRNDFFIVRTDSTSQYKSKMKFNDLNDIKSIERQIGNNYKINRYQEKLFDSDRTIIKYDDGLSLVLYSTLKDTSYRQVTFHITSEKYTMVTVDGRKITVGMNANDFEKIFPKSYFRREVITHSYKMDEKIKFPVYLSFYRNDKFYLEDSWITFILNKEGTSLEEFFLFVPD